LISFTPPSNNFCEAFTSQQSRSLHKSFRRNLYESLKMSDFGDDDVGMGGFVYPETTLLLEQTR
jgi:hypothetical protein